MEGACSQVRTHPRHCMYSMYTYGRHVCISNGFQLTCTRALFPVSNLTSDACVCTHVCVCLCVHTCAFACVHARVCLPVCAHLCICLCARTCVFACVCAHVCVCLCARTCAFACVRARVRLPVCAHVCVCLCVRTRVCLPVCAHVCVCLCVHTRVRLPVCVANKLYLLMVQAAGARELCIITLSVCLCVHVFCSAACWASGRMVCAATRWHASWTMMRPWTSG